ncbi:hypothetical protein QFZ37_002091 [Chryseobacterium ginsenosidimutans]|uniref:hypothetical protein n=1 Tax=Chryseobacterium ginsenosidimutans TaxID=687846 RepID=UPI002785D3C7|nr:hypothetical protein [Chryseobacterium ginsenosidimutans]MDQ0593722.1 hypothetical protein [Chryseobacterium ginsenosidimutans]
MQKEEYVPIADALLRSLTRDSSLFEAENHLFNPDYLAAMQSKTDEVRAKETGDAILVQQKQATQDLYVLGNELNKPMKFLNLVLKKSDVKTSLASDVLKKIRKRNFEGVLLNLKSLKQVVSAQSALLVSNGMKENTAEILENAFDAITVKSNEQTAFQQQRKAFTSANKGLYKELYAYVSEVANWGKIIFQGEQKAAEYTIDNLIAMVHTSRGSSGEGISEEKAPS